MSRLRVFSVREIAAQLKEPFSMANVGYIDDVLVSVYVCEGVLNWHKHVDTDELFWVQEGQMLLESARGDALLQAGELAVIPKGTRHRPHSSERATVLLVRCGLVPHRKNGRRQLYVTEKAGLTAVDLERTAQALASPFRFSSVARVEEAGVQLARGSGRWPIELPVAHDRMVYVLYGGLIVRTVRDRLQLGPGEFTIIPRGAFYHLHTEDDTLLAQVTREAL